MHVRIVQTVELMQISLLKLKVTNQRFGRHAYFNCQGYNSVYSKGTGK